MRSLTRRDLLSVLEFLRESYAISNLEKFRSRVVENLPRLIRSEVTGYNEIDTRGQRLKAHIDPPDAFGFPDAFQIFEQHMHEHPLIGYHTRVRDSRVLKISDFLTAPRFRDLGLYREFFRRVGVEHQMVCTLPAKLPILIGIALNRSGKDFTERDRLLLELLRPHLMQAHNNAAALTSALEELEATQRRLNEIEGLMILRWDGHTSWLSPGVHRLLGKYFSRKLGGERVPHPLKQWVRHQSEILSQFEVPQPLVMRKDGAQLTVRMLPGQDRIVLLFHEDPVAGKRLKPAATCLTMREDEVLGWVAQGKSNSEIAMILAISLRTVEKHLERVFEKLGVESRTAAAARFWESGRLNT
jgi:DNA-binding CsgD family transcriptional regulator